MTTKEAIVIKQLALEEESIKSIEATLDEAEDHGVTIRKDEIPWINKEGRKKFFDKFIEAAPVYRERIEQLETRWNAIEERLG